MKKNTLLLSLLFGSSTLLAGEPASLSHPSQLAQDLQHGHEHNDRQQTPKPPRLVSAHEFEKIQAKLHAKRNRKVLPAHLIPDADKTMRLQQFSIQSVCTSPDALLPLSGAALVSAIESANLTSCLYALNNQNLLGSGHFSDAKILTVVQAINSRMASFDGSDASGAAELEKLVSYLRAMHWVEAGSNRQFSAVYLSALQQAFDQYFAGAHFVRFDGNTSRNFMLRYEMLVLVSSSDTDRLRYLTRFSQALKGYTDTVSRRDNWGRAYEENGLTQVLTHYFNATNNGSAA
ncbi:M9 family metallopeptidase N-terminal domain-containing protein, partial [Arsukibacterium sp.]|uniref:M9 family metallopeptidase N-terminal domain-containing protein n=1 Tax=Arsukibacterium sp. TaxID=1977258 RepID=UPI002FD8D8C8